MLNERERAIRAAALIDSDGCISIAKERRGNFVILCMYVSTDKTVPEWLKANYGGSIFHEKSKHPKHKDAYRWKISAQKALTFINQIYPFLMVKTPLAVLAIEAKLIQSNWRGRLSDPEPAAKLNNVWLLAKRLNYRGVIEESV